MAVASSRVAPPAPAPALDGLAPPPEDALVLERARRFDDSVAADVLEVAAFELREAFDVPDEEVRRFDRDDDSPSSSDDPVREPRRDRPLDESVERDDRRFDREDPSPELDRDDDPADDPDREDELDRELRDPELLVRPALPDELPPVDVPPVALAPVPPALVDPPSSVRHALGSGMPDVRFAT